jgi:hypothetical protein
MSTFDEYDYIPATCSSCKVEMDCKHIYPYDNSDRCWDCFTKETGKTVDDINDQLAYMFPARNTDGSIKNPVWHKELLEKIQNRDKELKK